MESLFIYLCNRITDMRNIAKHTILLLLGMMLGCSCKDTDNLPEQIEAELSVQPSEIACDYKGGTFVIDVTCNGKWEIEDIDNRLTCDNRSGNSSSSFSLTVARRGIPEEWTGSLSITSQGMTRQVSVSQEACPVIKAETPHFEIDGQGGILESLYISDTETECISDCDWIRVIATQGTFRKVAFEVAGNPHDSPRNGTVTIRATEDHDICDIITVSQGKRIPHPELGFEEGSYLSVDSPCQFMLHPKFKDMTDTRLSWKSDSEDVASVDDTGMVTINGNGTCNITASNVFHDIDAVIKIEVRIKASGMVVFFGEQNMDENPVAVRYPGETTTINIHMTPQTAYTSDLTLLSSDPSVAEISGKSIRCIRQGKSTIFVESAYSNLRSSYTLIVLED